MSTIPTRDLNDGTTVPAVGFGTSGLTGDDAVATIGSAIEAGYRLLDTAVNYGNEREVGEAVRRSGVSREEFVVTSKLPGRHHGYEDAIGSVRESLDRLGLEQIDLHLIHWPNPEVGKYDQAWRALVQCQSDGLVRSIGVSNFTGEHLRRVIEDTGVTPAVNQIELHPYFPQPEMREVDGDLDVLTESWSPFARQASLFDEPAVREAADAHGVTPGQVVLRWQLDLGALPIPKSTDAGRQRQNLDLWSFELEAAEVAAISALGRPDGRWFGGDPETHDEQ